MNINSPITDIKGIGEKTKESFEKLGVYTIGDILLHFPRNYVLFPEIIDINDIDSFEEGHNYAIHCIIKKTPLVKPAGRLKLTILEIGESGHKIMVTWFNQPYLKSTLTVGKHIVLYGKISIKNGRYLLDHPEIYETQKYMIKAGTFQPVYPLTTGVKNNLILKTVRSALDLDELFADYVPLKYRKANDLCEYNYAIKQIHFPDSMERLIEARKRLVFDEFFLFIMGMQFQKEKQVKEKSNFIFKDKSFIRNILDKIPFTLTDAQLKVCDEIAKDLSGEFVMQRLIQGDVGSGKTIVAFLMMAWASYNGFQSAIMAPTEVLAKQHYDSYCKMCEDYGIDSKVILLTGSMTAKQKRQANERIALYPDAMIIGTHALIQESVDYNNLGLVITDEQHRFGVKQRDAFSGKGDSPHILVMSATPIPRTLAIIIYGDMDISVIDQVPAKRLPIKNCVVDTNYRTKAYEFIENQVKEGRQVYVICPLVEESENYEGENVIDYAKKLSENLSKDITIGVLHGKMKSDMKTKIMNEFSNNKINVLVSTTVVEVGVNVPNATVMMIENADRFGLAQLHQLRGRVGRGDAQSYCIMVNTSKSKDSKKRLEILNQSNDGFYIASEDLKLRGPGDFFGIRQSGDIVFKLGDIYQDATVLQSASVAVKEILEKDPDLKMEENKALKVQMERFVDNQIKRMNL